jgi:excisionase family DNA binding protein
MSEVWLTAQQVADMIGVSRSWILRKAKAGIAPHIRIGGVIRFSENAIEIWMKNHGIKGTLKV